MANWWASSPKPISFGLFLEVLGAREAGVRLTMLVPEEQGMLASVTGEIAGMGGNILALSTSRGEDPTNRTVTVKVAGVPRKSWWRSWKLWAWKSSTCGRD